MSTITMNTESAASMVAPVNVTVEEIVTQSFETVAGKAKLATMIRIFVEEHGNPSDKKARKELSKPVLDAIRGGAKIKDLEKSHKELEFGNVTFMAYNASKMAFSRIWKKLDLQLVTIETTPPEAPVSEPVEEDSEPSNKIKETDDIRYNKMMAQINGAIAAYVLGGDESDTTKATIGCVITALKAQL